MEIHSALTNYPNVVNSEKLTITVNIEPDILEDLLSFNGFKNTAPYFEPELKSNITIYVSQEVSN